MYYVIAVIVATLLTLPLAFLVRDGRGVVVVAGYYLLSCGILVGFVYIIGITT